MTNRSTGTGPAPPVAPATTRHFSNARLALAMVLTLAGIAISACAPAEDPARVELRARLKQETRLSEAELGRLCDELARSIEKKSVRITVHDGPVITDGDRRAEVFSVLRDRA